MKFLKKYYKYIILILIIILLLILVYLIITKYTKLIQPYDDLYAIKKTYLINLDIRPDRLKFIDEMLKRENIDYIRFPAIYGKELKDDDPAYKQYFNESVKLSPGQYGCALSHIKIYEMIVNDNELNDEDLICIFEDDITLETDFKNKTNEFIKNINKLDKDWRIALLGVYMKNGSPTEYQNILKVNHTPNYGTFGYCIRKKMAKQLLENISKNKMYTTIDDYIVNTYYADHCYMIEPLIANHLHTFESNINVK
jgi:GR25 family glycosyltransferase involved in LPS biosynthesis